MSRLPVDMMQVGQTSRECDAGVPGHCVGKVAGLVAGRLRPQARDVRPAEGGAVRCCRPGVIPAQMCHPCGKAFVGRSGSRAGAGEQEGGWPEGG